MKTKTQWIVRLRDLVDKDGRHLPLYYLKCDNAFSVRRARPGRKVRRQWGLRTSRFGAWRFDDLADAKRTAKTCVAIKDKQEKAEKNGYGLFIEIVEVVLDARTRKQISKQGVHWIGCPPLLVLALQGTKHG